MKTAELRETDVTDLDVFANPCDLRRDLHAFSHYVSSNDTKRAHRGNSLPKAHLKRIAKMMSDPLLAKDVDEDGYSHWVNFVDSLCLKLGFVDYDTQGGYQGYSSYTRSYPDNYIEFSSSAYSNFMNQSLQQQEDQILKALTDDAEPCRNEFFVSDPLAALDRFDSYGCATGIMKHILFPQVRIYLLQHLANCRPGVWYSTASLIQHLKNSNPFFLIPEKLPLKGVEYRQDRYHNFKEREPGNRWGESWGVGQMKDRFERVEGRFVERFLEGLPLSMGYVEVAYSSGEDKVRPSMGKLRAFRITDLLSCSMERSIKEPQIRVLPNHEIHVDSMFYPATTIDTLLDLCDVVTDGVHMVLKPVKKKVMAQLVVDEKLDVNGLLRGLSAHAVPANVEREITSWTEHADNFVLYDGFGLLEGSIDKETAARFVAAPIAPDVNIVRSPKKLYDHLEKAGRIPLYADHSDSAFKSLPKTVQSKFVEQNRPSKPKTRKRERLTVKRTVHSILEFPDKETYEAFIGALPDDGPVLDTSSQTRTVSYTRKDEKAVLNTLNALKKRYDAVMKDV